MRRERRNTPNMFTDEDYEKLNRKIEEEPHYISEKLGLELDKLVRLRDKTLISTVQSFFKRGREVLKLKRKDTTQGLFRYRINGLACWKNSLKHQRVFTATMLGSYQANFRRQRWRLARKLNDPRFLKITFTTLRH